MAKHFLQKNKGKIALGVILLVVVVWGLATGWRFLTPQGSAGFSAPEAKNAINGKSIDNDDVTYETWAIKTGDISAWSQDRKGLFATYAVMIDNGTSLSDWELTSAQKEDYGAFFLKAWAVNENATFRPFMANWIEISLSGSNVINLMPTPTAVGMAFIDSSTGLYRAFNITQPTNFTVYISVNSTEQGLAGYNKQFNYTAGYDSQVMLVIRFNATIAKNDIQSSRMAIEVLASDTLGFTISTMLVSSFTNSFTWSGAEFKAYNARLCYDFWGANKTLASVAATVA